MRITLVTKRSAAAIGALLVGVLVMVSVAGSHLLASAAQLDSTGPIHSATAYVSASKTQVFAKKTSIKPIVVKLSLKTPALVTLSSAAHTAAQPTPQSPSPSLLPIVAQSSIHANQQILADAVLRRLPSLCRDNLKNFFILYRGATQRGLGGKSTIIIDGSVGDNEFVGLLTHECGHVIHGNLLGNIATGASNFKDGNDVFAKDSPAIGFWSISWSNQNTMRKGSIPQDFVTGYADTNAFEDFAETFATYVLEKPSMEAHAKTNTAVAAKLAWMEKNLPLADDILGTPLYSFTGSIPWDATKLPFAWAPTTPVASN